MENVTIAVDAETARLLAESPAEVQEKLRLLLRLWVREFVTSPRPLQQIMDEISQRAEARGLTPQILQSLLNEH